MCDTYMRVKQNVSRVRPTIETHVVVFSDSRLFLQLVFVRLSNNIFTNTATNVNNIKKISLVFVFFRGFQI